MNRLFLLLLFLSAPLFGGDKQYSAPSGDLILDADTGNQIIVKKEAVFQGGTGDLAVSGDVAIGKAVDSTYSLDVYSNKAAAFGGIRVYNDASDGTGGIAIGDHNGFVQGRLYNNASGKLFLEAVLTNGLDIVSNSNTALSIDSSGRVGIGVSPSELLEIYGDDTGVLTRYHDTGTAEYKVGIPAGSSSLYLTNSSGSGSGATTAKGLMINVDGDVSIGQAPASSYKLFIKNDNAPSVVFAQNSTSNVVFEILDGGPINVFSTGWSSTSGGSLVRVEGGQLKLDSSTKRVKKNITSLENINTKDIYKLQPVEFDFINGGGHGFGYVAEDVLALGLPYLVGMDDVNGKAEPVSVAYDKLSVLILEELKKVKAENTLMKQWICSQADAPALCNQG